MKRALIASWVLFALVFATRSIADYAINDRNGTAHTVAASEAHGVLRLNVHLEDDEIERIREACR